MITFSDDTIIADDNILLSMIFFVENLLQLAVDVGKRTDAKLTLIKIIFS